MEEYSDICALLGIQENHPAQLCQNQITYDYNENLPNGMKYEIGDNMQIFAAEFAQFEKCAMDKSDQLEYDVSEEKQNEPNENDLFDPDDLLDILAEGERGEVHAGSNFSDGYEFGCPGVAGNSDFDIQIEELAGMPLGRVTGFDPFWDELNSVQFNERVAARGEEGSAEVSYIVSGSSSISKIYQNPDLMEEAESDSGVDSMNSMSPQGSLSSLASPPELSISSPSPPPSPQSIPINSSIPELFPAHSKKVAALPSPSIASLLPNSPLSKTELNLVDPTQFCSKSILKSELGLLPEFHDTSTLFAVPPSLLTRDNYSSRKTSRNTIWTSNSSCSQQTIPMSSPITQNSPQVRPQELKSKKPSLLSSLLSIPPMETESSKQLTTLLNQTTSISSILSSLSKQSKVESQLVSDDVYSEFVDYINIHSGDISAVPPSSATTKADSSQEQGNTRPEQELLSLPTLETELTGIRAALDMDTVETQLLRSAMDFDTGETQLLRPALDFDTMETQMLKSALDMDTVETQILKPALDLDHGETPARKKLIISKRKKELAGVSVGGISMETLLNQANIKVIQPWDIDLRMQMVGVGGIPVSRPSFGCGTCEFRTSDQQLLENHQLSHAAEKAFQCPTCGINFVTSSARSAHRRQVHQRHHLCHTCDRAFSTSQKLDRHLRTHTGVKEFKCETCKKEFSLEENLKMHYNVHLGKKNFICYICQREYFTRSGLNHHLKQVHGSEKLVKCLKCDFIGKTRYDVETHHKIDHVESSLKCDPCNQQFQNKQELKKHIMDDHSGGRSFICTVCTHRSKSQSKLNIHMRQHTLNKIHSCDHCGQKFAFKNSLTKHLSKGRCIILKKSLQCPPVPIQADPTLCQNPGPSL